MRTIFTAFLLLLSSPFLAHADTVEFGKAESECYRTAQGSDDTNKRAIFAQCMITRGYDFTLPMGEPEAYCFRQTKDYPQEEKSNRFYECLAKFGFSKGK